MSFFQRFGKKLCIVHCALCIVYYLCPLMRRLRQAITFFMMPFSLTKGEADFGMTDFVMPSDACWQPAAMNVDRGVFLSHIQRFLQASVSEQVRRTHASGDGNYRLRDCDYRVFGINEKSSLHGHVLTQRLVVSTGRGEAGQGIAFTIGQRKASFLSPKLVVCPNAGVGLLMLPVIPEIGDDTTMKQLVHFNYLLHKTDGQSCSIRLDNTAANKHYRQPHTRDGKQYPGSEQKLAQALSMKYDAARQSAPFGMPRLIAALMRGIGYRRFNDDVLHVFTYVDIEPEYHKEAEKPLGYDFTRLVMCLSPGYRVTAEQVDKVMRQSTFENVFMGSTASGGAIMTVTGDDAPQYLQEFVTGSLQPRYLWIYVMMLMQRHSLLNMTNWLINIDLDGDTDQTLVRVRRAVRHMSELTVNNRFSTISDYTHHNAFYHQCCDVLGIDTLHAEVEQKLDTLNDLVEQLSTEKKEQVDASKEFWQAALAIILAVLTVFSATNDGIEMLNKLGMPERYNIAATWIFLIVIIALGVKLVGIRFFKLFTSQRTKNHQHE